MSMDADKFCHLFSNFNLVVRCKGDSSRKRATEEDVMDISQSQLKTLLKKAIEEYKHAQKLYKRYKISREELFDYEWRVFELRSKIDKSNNEGVL
mgnify:CR=1 FL=1|jgi:hypothetical protein